METFRGHQSPPRMHKAQEHRKGKEIKLLMIHESLLLDSTLLELLANSRKMCSRPSGGVAPDISVLFSGEEKNRSL